MEQTGWNREAEYKELENARMRAGLLAEDPPAGPFIVAFCGIFSSGKSSLLNALMNLKGDDRLPTGITPVTKVITRIEYGKNWQASYVTEGKTVFLSRERFKQIAAGDAELPLDCTEITLKVPSALPGRNMVFLDTPGFQDNAALEEITRRAVRKADLAVFCSHANNYGKLFEQGYYQELEDSIGNYCVVINKADYVPEDEFSRLETFVEKTVCGRGRKRLGLYADQTVFYTVAAGKQIDLDGLDAFFNGLRDHEQSRKALQDFAGKRRQLYALKELREQVREKAEAVKSVREEREKESEKSWREEIRQYKGTCRTIRRETEDLKTGFQNLIDERFEDLFAKIKALEAAGKRDGFSASVKGMIRGISEELIRTMRDERPRYPLLYPYHRPDLFADSIDRIAETFHVPQPQGHFEKRRGLGGQILESITMSIFTGSIYVDDGFDMVYRGYAETENMVIRKSLLPKVKVCTMNYLNKVAADAKPEPPVMDTSELDEIDRNLAEWQELDEILWERSQDKTQ